MRHPALALVLLFAVPVVAQDVPVDPARFQGMEWRNIGPFRGGRAVAAAGVPSRPHTFYHGAVGSGVWKTDDAGGTWTNVSDSTFGTSSVGAIAVAPSDPNVVYVGMGEHAIRGVMTSHGDGIYRSTDAGRSWKHVGLPGSRAISRIVVHPSNPELVYVAAQGAPYGPSEDRGIFRSRDGGATWQKILYVSEVAGASDLRMDPRNPRILYAAFWDHQRFPWMVRSGGPGSGFHKSTDGGDTWIPLTEGFPKLMGKTDIAVSADSDRLYALVEADPGGGFYRSDDAGRTWKLVTDNPTIRARPWYYINVFPDPKNPDVIWVLNAPIMKSIDGGKSFAPVRATHGDNHDLWINPDNPDVMINVNDGGASVTLNGGRTWSTQGNQPTGQFYRVTLDDRFPYHVYGGQQDNSAIAIAAFTSGGGITEEDWYDVAGCETSVPAFDPADPDLSLGGCYMGMLNAYDASLRAGRDAQAWPLFPAAFASRDMKYRFNWSAPLLTSQHDPSVLYHGANVLLRSRDGGVSWREASPDLTRDDDAHQGPGGGPITGEGAGGEIYGTIYTIAESPLDANVLWTGSDDGLVHVTRDGGATWENVTPKGLPEAIVNAVEASPHAAGTAYVAVTRYKFNDFTPMAFRTTDYGKSWTRIVDGIAPDHHVRVVREDPRRPGLLYAGTEGGLYVSWDAGAKWQSLQLGMPLTYITDLKVQRRHNDLVASTGGRGFWILDDLGPLQQALPAVDGAVFFRPEPAVRMAGGQGRSTSPTIGRNPLPGAILDFVLGEVSDSTEVILEIMDPGGVVVRTYGTGKGEAVGDDKLAVKAGHNRTNWDLRREAVRNLPNQYTWGSLQGMRVPPGEYRVRLTVDGVSVEQPLPVLPDPRIVAKPAGFAEQDALGTRVTAGLDRLHAGIRKIRAARAQIEAFLERAPDDAEVDSLGAALVKDLSAVEDSLVQRRVVDGQTVINYPARLRAQYTNLRGLVDSSEGEVTAGALAYAHEIEGALERHLETLERLLTGDLARFNALVAEKRIPAIILPDAN